MRGNGLLQCRDQISFQRQHRNSTYPMINESYTFVVSIYAPFKIDDFRLPEVQGSRA